jgi:hypothetical protein
VGIHDNFFALGGHSLIAVQVAARMRDSFKVDVALRRIFESPTIAQLAQVVDQEVQPAGINPAPSLLLPDIKRIARPSPEQGEISFPASYAQQRLWFIDQLMPGKAAYNIPNALRIRGELDEEVLERTLQEIVFRHEMLRTRFVAVHGEPQQVIEEQVRVELPLTDLSHLTEDERETEARRLAQVEAQEPFNLQHRLQVSPKICWIYLTSVLSASSPLYNPIQRPHSAQSYKPSSNGRSDVLKLNMDREEATIGAPQFQQMQLVEQQDQYLSQRGQAIESIESTIHELGSIFQQLAQMVSEQVDTVKRSPLSWPKAIE